ncbi:MAG: LapA family protein [Xenococcaceae cyanobacterium MO_207.B15]|nr:LapA family protein [Xenococcaceae cyanobacterium MO_207.B15]
MKIFTNFISSVMLAMGISAIAVFSIQNIEPVSLKFLGFESIQFPLGVLLAFCAGVGIILGSLLPLLWQQQNPYFSKNKNSDFKG